MSSSLVNVLALEIPNVRYDHVGSTGVSVRQLVDIDIIPACCKSGKDGVPSVSGLRDIKDKTCSQVILS